MSIRNSPRGKRPVFCSRKRNSMVLSDAATVSGSMPFLARSVSVSRISFSTLSRFSCLDALQAGVEDSLAQVIFMAAGHILAQAGIEQGFLERRGRGSQQHMRENVQSHAGLQVVLAQHPVDGYVGFGIFRIAGIVWDQFSGWAFRSVACSGTWELTSFSSNSFNQVVQHVLVARLQGRHRRTRCRRWTGGNNSRGRL